jgi:hypothetical protein
VRPLALRGQDRRANAGFAAVAVALLVLGGAAALYLQAVDLGQADERAIEAAEREALRLELEGDQATLSEAAYRELANALATSFQPGPGGLANVSRAVEQTLRARLAANYPRQASGSGEVSAQLVFAHTFAIDADAQVPSPLGGRTVATVPAYVAVEGLANLTASGRGLNYSEAAPFFARFPVPILLVESLAAQITAEASPGGRVERLAGQFAQSVLNAPSNRTLTDSRAAGIVRAALGAELRLDLGTSGEPTLDAAIAAEGNARGSFAASDLFEGPVSPAEEFPVADTGRSFAVEGEASPVTLDLTGVDFTGVETSVAWQFFDGQELGSGIWGALQFNVSGALVLTLRVTSAQGSFDVGPVRVPVAFTARAMQAAVPALCALAPARFEGAFNNLVTFGALSAYSVVLQQAGVPRGPDGNYSDNATTREALAPFLYEDMRSALAPVESTVAFGAAYMPEVWAFTPGLARVNATLPIDGANARLTLDGVPAYSGTVEGGAVRLARMPQGLHALRLSIASNGTPYTGGAMLSVGPSPWDVEIPVAPTLPLDYFQAALARGEALRERAGLALLDEAAKSVGLTRSGEFATVGEAVAFGEVALGRMEALGLASLSSATLLQQKQDAQSFLKIMVGLLRAADAAYFELENKSMPIGAVAGASARLTLRADPAALVSVALSGMVLATAVANSTSIGVTFLFAKAPPKTLHFPGDHLILILTSLAGALTLAADGVRIIQTFAADSRADLGDRALVVAGSASDFANIAFGIARGVYALYGRAVLDAAKIPFLKIATALAAVTLLLDLAALYHDNEGNFTAMVEELIRPATVGGLTRLPGLASGAATVVANLLYLSGAIAEPLGPVGIAAGLFVLAALIVLNKDKVASAIWGTLPFEAVDEIRAQVGAAVKIGFTGEAVANTLSLERLAQARRAASASRASAWLASVTESASDASELALSKSTRGAVSASAIDALIDSTLRLKASSTALVEELDDFASPPYDVDTGRLTEGYRALHTLAGEFPYRGSVVVIDAPEGTHGREIIRAEWRGFLRTLTTGDLPNWSFAYELTDTNAIPQSQFSLWSGKVTAAGGAFESAFQAFQAAAQRLRPDAA